MALSVKGFRCQARLCGLSWEQWEPLNTSKHVKCAILPQLHSGAHAGYDVLGYICLIRDHKGRVRVTLGIKGWGENPHFKCWPLTFNHVILSGNPFQHRQLTTPLPTTYAGQKQLVCPILLCRVKPLGRSSPHCLTQAWGKTKVKGAGTGDDSVPSQPSHFLSSASLEWTPLHPWHLPLPLG